MGGGGPIDSSKVIIKVPIALDADIAAPNEVFGEGVHNPPVLMIPVDRVAYETNPKPIMEEIHKRVDRIQRIAREKGTNIIDLLKEKGWVA